MGIWYEETTETTTVDETDYDVNHSLLQKIGAVAEATLNIALFGLEMQLDEMEIRAKQGDPVAKEVDTAAYRAAAYAQRDKIKQLLGRI